jgi:inhibitor of cysteine peptidase
MERKLFSLLVAGIVFSTAMAWNQATHAALCGKCREMLFVDSDGKCKDCGASTTSGALQICPKCSAKRHQCEHCLAATTRQDESVPDSKPADPAPDQPRSGNPRSDEVRDRPTPLWTPPANQPNRVKPDEVPATQPAGPEITPLPPVTAKPDIPTPRDVAPESKPPSELSADPAAPTKLKPINPAKAGVYTAGKWRYQLQITNPATQSEGRWGWLTYDGQKLPRGDVNDFYNTPWGPVYWVDVPQTSWGVHGWMPVPLQQNRRQGRVLASPASSMTASPTNSGGSITHPAIPPMASGTNAAASPRPQMLEINKSHNGQLARLRVGNVVVIRLPGNPATGYQWQAASSNNTAVRLTVRPQYSPPASTATQAAAVGTFIFTYQAVQPGSGVVRFYYVRPNDPSRPRDSFSLNVNVSPATTAGAARPTAAAASRDSQR